MVPLSVVKASTDRIGGFCCQRELTEWSPEDRTGTENHRPFNEVLEFADITWPAPADKGLYRFGSDRGDLPIHAPGVLSSKVIDQNRNVVGALPKGRNVDWEDFQPIVEIGAELMLFYHFCEVAIRGRYQADVHRDGAATAQAFKLLFLQGTKDLRL